MENRSMAACPFLVAVLAAALPAGDGGSPPPFRPEFHGPRRDNISEEKGLLAQWPEGGPRRVWTYEGCGEGYASVSIAEGRIFTSGVLDGREAVMALDLDGKPRWKTPCGPGWRGSAPGARSTPTWRDGVLFHMGPTGRVTALRAATGAEVWSVETRERFGSEGGAWALAESVLVEGRKVLCAPGGERGRVVALDRETGSTVWAKNISLNLAHPVVCGGRLYLRQESVLYAYEIRR